MWGYCTRCNIFLAAVKGWQQLVWLPCSWTKTMHASAKTARACCCLELDCRALQMRPQKNLPHSRHFPSTAQLYGMVCQLLSLFIVFMSAVYFYRNWNPNISQKQMWSVLFCLPAESCCSTWAPGLRHGLYMSWSETAASHPDWAQGFSLSPQMENNISISQQ